MIRAIIATAAPLGDANSIFLHCHCIEAVSIASSDLSFELDIWSLANDGRCLGRRGVVSRRRRAAALLVGAEGALLGRTFNVREQLVTHVVSVRALVYVAVLAEAEQNRVDARAIDVQEEGRRREAQQSSQLCQIETS